VLDQSFWELNAPDGRIDVSIPPMLLCSDNSGPKAGIGMNLFFNLFTTTFVTL
jgi:hypothetical protein